MSEYNLSPIDLYLFDTAGVLHMPRLASESEVNAARKELDSLLEADCGFAAMRRWERLTHQSTLFRDLATDPRILARVREVINQPLRLIESYAIERSAHSELLMHGGAAELMELPDSRTATRDMSIFHSYKDGQLFCLYVKVLVYLDDVDGEEDGLFTWLAGSHKANFPLLRAWYADGERELIARSNLPTLCHQPVKAGDGLMINEAILHGTTSKSTGQLRRFAAFSYAPSFMADWREISSSEKLDIHDSGYADADVEENLRAGVVGASS